MAPVILSTEAQIKLLKDARKAVLGDAAHYTAIIPGILPLIDARARDQPERTHSDKVTLARWGTGFLAEAFASPALASERKETLQLTVLEVLKNMIEDPTQESEVMKNIIQCAASLYPIMFRWIINNDYDRDNWERIQVIKSRILRIWDTAAAGVRMCCIKFAQRVVLCQTVGPEADPVRGDPMEVSLGMVQPNNTLLKRRDLEAEAHGLLDRMLGVFQENISDAVLVDATLNTLAVLIRTRPQIAPRIINSILGFNPLKQANSPMTPKLRVIVKSMEKTTRILLINVMKRDPQNPLAGRIQQYVERMMRSRNEIFDEASRKRGPPEPSDGLDATKRQKLQAQVHAPVQKFYVPPLAPGPHTIAEIFTVTTDEGLKAFDVSQIPENMVVKIGISIMQKLNADTLNQAIEGVRQRYESMKALPPVHSMQSEQINPATAPLSVEEDEDDYDPDYLAEDSEQILNKLDSAPPPVEEIVKSSEDAHAAYSLPPPPNMTSAEVEQVSMGTVARVFGVMQTLDEPAKKSKAGLNRLAASSCDRDDWITIITRLATRSIAGLEEPESVKVEPDSAVSFSLSNTIRHSLFTYVLEDFRKRIDIAVAWLCEEWYNDKVQMKLGENTVLHYEKWVLKVLDGIVPYLDSKDKVLTRLLSEIPGVSLEVLGRVKVLCRDPAMVNLALTSLLYLVIYKPPAREMALDAVEDIWVTYDDAKTVAAKYLTKYRPHFEAKYEKKNEEGKIDDVVDAMAISA